MNVLNSLSPPPPLGVSVMRRLVLFAAALIGISALPAFAEPEVWLKSNNHPTGWQKGEITFGMKCAGVRAQVPVALYDSEGNYIETGAQWGDTRNPASSSFLVEGRNIGKDQGYLDDMIQPDHPSYDPESPNDTWGDRCPICVVHPKYDLTIRLDATSTLYQDTLHMGSFRLVGANNVNPLRVMRSWNTRHRHKNVTIGAFCAGKDNRTFSVTVKATITRTDLIN